MKRKYVIETFQRVYVSGTLPTLALPPSPLPPHSCRPLFSRVPPLCASVGHVQRQAPPFRAGVRATPPLRKRGM